MSIVFDRILGFCLLKVKSRMIVAAPLTVMVTSSKT
ncbi:hypothetical protein J2T12_004063 [Paenibacillus anaericanus]|nr:hypothetical protein [Paenibacillus anaericanus]